MQQRLMICLTLALVFLFAACQGPPPTQIILVVTATPDESTAEIVATEMTAEPQAATEEPTQAPTKKPTSEPTPTTSNVPTPTITQIQVAEQVFEHGRMFWVQPTEQIWIMLITREGGGEWKIYNDDFTDGDIEFDPNMNVPQGFEQPKRGFGKLWRDNPDLREALGWAVTPEFGYVTRYEYHPGAESGQPGYHLLFSLYNEGFRFNEADQTWQLN